ncbi:MAG: hypothetical protein JW863_04180 [Chitinispirillaceae bacterium]|nr:hypothetical protein [Chitinispirillaceae bacterium]
MKKIFCICLLIVILPVEVIPDVAPPLGSGTHSVARNIFIVNTTELGAIRLIAWGATHRWGVVSDTSDLGDVVYLSAISDSSLTLLGGINSLQRTPIGLGGDIPSVSLITGPSRISDNYSLVSEDFYYRVDTISDGMVVLKLNKRVLGYNDGGADETIE